MSQLSNKAIFLYSPLFVILYNLLGNLSNDIYLPVLPVLAEELGTSDFLVQFSITVWFLGVAIPQIYFGIIADKFGSRPLMLWGGVIFLIGSLICYFSINIYLLLLGRFLQGIGVSSLNIATFTTVRSKFYDEKKSIKFISWVNVMGSIAPLLGPIIGSYLAHLLGWRSTFSFILILGLLILAGLYYFLIEGNETPKNLEVRINFASSLAYYKPLFKNKYLWSLLLAYTSFLGALIAYLTTAPFIITQQFNIHLEYFGLTQLPPSLAFLLGAWSVNPLINKYGLERIIFFGLKIIGVSALYFILLSFISRFFTVYNYLLAASLFMYGFALVSSPLMNLSLAVGSSQKGGISALLGLTMASMAGISSLLTALLFRGKPASSTLVILGFILVGNLSYFIGKKRAYND